METLQQHPATAAVTFRATVDLDGRTATGIRVPADAVAALGPQRQPLVLVTLGAHTYRSRVAVRGGVFKLPVSAENRSAAGVEAGDEVEVTLALDTEPRLITVPADLSDALDAEPRARTAFDALSYSGKQRWVLSVEGAKTAATRERRIERAVQELAA